VAQADKQFRNQHSYDLIKTNSVIFNAFILMQVRIISQALPCLWLGFHTADAMVCCARPPTQDFLCAQLFNQINAREINDELNVFRGLLKSQLFIYITLVEAALQVLKTLNLVVYRAFPFVGMSEAERLTAGIHTCRHVRARVCVAFSTGDHHGDAREQLLQGELAELAGVAGRHRPGRGLHLCLTHHQAHDQVGVL
jgi:hypothetical protein